MHPAIPSILIPVLLASPMPWAAAQAVYRCGSSYSQEPCPGGKAIDVTDRASAADATRSARGAKVDAQRADALEKARLAQEKDAPKAIVMGAPPTAQARPAKDAKDTGDKKKKGQEKPFTATAPAKK